MVAVNAKNKVNPKVKKIYFMLFLNSKINKGRITSGMKVTLVAIPIAASKEKINTYLFSFILILSYKKQIIALVYKGTKIIRKFSGAIMVHEYRISVERNGDNCNNKVRKM